jgi:hypothetical protein
MPSLDTYAREVLAKNGQLLSADSSWILLPLLPLLRFCQLLSAVGSWILPLLLPFCQLFACWQQLLRM